MTTTTLKKLSAAAVAMAAVAVSTASAQSISSPSPSYGWSLAQQEDQQQQGFPTGLGEMFRLFATFDDEQPLFPLTRSAQQNQPLQREDDAFAPFLRLSQTLAEHRRQQQQQQQVEEPSAIYIRFQDQQDDEPQDRFFLRQRQQLQRQQQQEEEEEDQGLSVGAVTPMLHGLMNLLHGLAMGGEDDATPAPPMMMGGAMPPMFTFRLIGVQEDDEPQQEQEEEPEDEDERPCPFVVACQNDVLTLCRGAVLAEQEGAVARCLVDKFPLLSPACSAFVRARVAADADADAEPIGDVYDDATMTDDLGDLDDGADDLDGMAAGLLSCERDAETVCPDAVAKAAEDPTAIQRCLVDRRERLSDDCRVLVDYMLASANPDTAELEGQAGRPPVDGGAVPATPTEAVPAEGPAAAEQRCRDDAARLCGAEEGRVATLACLHRQAQDLSEACSAALDELPAFHCAEDAARFCSAARSRIGVIKCLHSHSAELSAECRDSVVQHRQLRQTAAPAPAPASVADRVSHLRETVAREVNRRVVHARSNPLPAFAFTGVFALLAAAFVVYVRRRTVSRRRLRHSKEKDLDSRLAAEDFKMVELSPAGSSFSASEARSRPGVLMPAASAAAGDDSVEL